MLGLAFCGAADAGTYVVYQCENGSGDAGQPINGIGAAATLYASCPAPRDNFQGIVAGVARSTLTFGNGAHAFYHFQAPGPNRLRWVFLHASMMCGGKGWYSGLFDGGFGWFWGYDAGQLGSEKACLSDWVPDGQRPYVAVSTGMRAAVRWGILCRAVACPADTGDPSYRFRAGASSLIFTVEDPAGAQVRLTGGGLASGRWVSGVQDLTYDAVDAAGVRRVALVIDNGSPRFQDFDCRDATFPALKNPYYGTGDGWQQEWEAAKARPTYASFQPCPSVYGGRYTVNTGELADGEHQVRLAAVDAAANFSVDPNAYVVRVDNTAPPEVTGEVDPSPRSLNPQDPSAWRRENRFTVRWRNPDRLGGSPYGTVEWELCRLDGQRCSIHSRLVDGEGGARNAITTQVPEIGEWQLRLRLRDDAGHAGPWSAARILRFDDRTPPPSSPANANGWLNDREAADYAQRITLDRRVENNSDLIPPSAIAGYSVAFDRDPDDTLDVPANGDRAGLFPAIWQLHDLPEGEHEVRAKAISGSGVVHPSFQYATLRVDRTPPVAFTNAGPPGRWHTQPVTVTVTARDQQRLSGMQRDETQEDPGGYVRIQGPDGDQLCAGETHEEASCTVTLRRDGRHQIVYEAVDVAGNSSGERSIVVLVDATAPSGWIDTPPADDPARVIGRVTDGVSGVAGARFELRAPGGDWRALPTEKLAADLFAAQLPDDRLAPGPYEVRLLAKDNAGNIAEIEQLRDPAGHLVPARFNFPLRLRPRLELAQRRAGAHRPSPQLVAIALLRGRTVRVFGRVEPRGQGRVRLVVRAGSTRRVIECRLRSGRFSASTSLRRVARRVGVTLLYSGSAELAPARLSFVAKRSGGEGLRGVARLDLDVVPEALPFGSGTAIQGRLMAPDGRPLGGTRITVARQPLGDWGVESLGAVVTEPDGRFALQVPAGPSAQLAFTYSGSSTLLPLVATIPVRVSGRVTLRLSRRALRNGQTLRLSGRVFGGYVPRPGLVVALQALAADTWRTFQTVRTDGAGRFTSTYTFRATLVKSRYRLRALVLRDQDWPYEPAASPIARVTVTPSSRGHR